MSLPWIKIATDMKSDPSIGHIADACDVPIYAAVGLAVNVLGEMAAKAKDGNISSIPDRTLEAWAGWDGKRGRFSVAFRESLCLADGTVRSWEKYNGASIRKNERDTEALRAKRSRGRRADVADLSRDSSATVALGSRLEMEKEIEITTGSYKQGEEYPPSAPASVPAEALSVVSREAHAALAELFRHVPDAAIWTGLLRGYASGSLMDSNRPCEASRLGVAVVDFVAAGKHLAPGGPNPALFRGFVKKARAPERQYANQQTEAEYYADQLASIRRKNQRRALTGQPLMEEPKWAGQIDQMFPDGRTHPTGQAA